MLFILRLCNNAHGNEVWDKTWLGSEEKSIEHYENYESMFRPLVLDIFSWLRYLITFRQKYCSCIVRLQLVECWMMQFTSEELFFFSLWVYTLCVFHLVGLGRYTLNKCHFSVVSSASFLSVDPFKLSIPFLPLSSPVSFFHEQEGFTLLLCHPNWLH